MGLTRRAEILIDKERDDYRNDLFDVVNDLESYFEQDSALRAMEQNRIELLGFVYSASKRETGIDIDRQRLSILIDKRRKLIYLIYSEIGDCYKLM